MSIAFGPEHLQKAQVPLTLPMTYLHLNRGEDKPLLIFFHGYSDNASAFLRRSFPSVDARYEILAINGPFPVPVRHGEGWKQAFAWYFADPSKNDVLIHPGVAAQAVDHLLAQLKLQSRPKILIGFSQGGFFLPFVLPLLRNVRKIFGIGAAYRSRDYGSALSIPLDAFHGEDDEIVSWKGSVESFEDLKSLNPQGQYHSFKGLGHTMNDESRSLLKMKIDEVFFA